LPESVQLFSGVEFGFLVDLKFSEKVFFLEIGEVEIGLKFLEFFLKLSDLFFPFEQEVFVLVPFEFGRSEHTFD
jgi:hypothetical protein